ncbi:MAG: hypothetical protein KAR32_14670, partial [Candidatus Omnitrophica bacterium]|nr:hypothetical protein [Candidatus Omnitrophota bacterium]
MVASPGAQSRDQGDTARANDMEMDIAIHFLETIHPISAEFVKEMASQNRLGSLDLHQYVAMTKREMNSAWVHMVNKNSLGHIALGDMNQQMKQYERDLSQYAQSGGERISITQLAGDYVRVGQKDMPYDLVSLMAQEPAEPQKLAFAIGARIPSMEPAHLDAVHTLATISPQEVRIAMNKAGKTIGMEQYEIDGMIREVEILRVGAASTEIGRAHELIEQERSFLLYTMVAKPKAVVWLAQASNPVQPGDLRVASTLIAEKMVAFSSVPIMKFNDVSRNVEMLVPGRTGIRTLPFNAQEAVRFQENKTKPIYVGSSMSEARRLRAIVVTIASSEILRLKNPRASKFTDMNNISITRIEQATTAATRITRNAGIEFNRQSMTVIPTQYADDKIVVLSVPTMADYKNMRDQRKRNVGKSAANSEVYFY